MLLEKIQGCGNDFLIADGSQTPVISPQLVRQLCERHTGFGADGVILGHHSPLTMELWNADGSQASMCGNGLRCFMHYAWRRGWLRPREQVGIGTGDGVKTAAVISVDPFLCRVNMGRPDFDPHRLCSSPCLPGLLHAPFLSEVQSCSFWMGVPHTVILTHDISAVSEENARSIGTHSFFKEGTNVDFVMLKDQDEIRIRTWERGIGWTLACGTGACASAVACRLFGLKPLPLIVESSGGIVRVEENENQELILTGPSQYVGRIEVNGD